VTWVLRVAVFVAPVLMFLLTKRICIGLQHSDQERLLHGAETGVIERSPAGRFSERHRTISVAEQYLLTQHKEPLPLAPVASDDGEFTEKEIKAEQRRRRATRFYFLDTLRKPTKGELAAAIEHQHHLAAAAHGDGHDGHDGHGNGHGNGHAAAGHELTADAGGDEHTQFGTESEHMAP
jgi:ubiquinol-cytochrome c reductase cytochrome b subunit